MDCRIKSSIMYVIIFLDYLFKSRIRKSDIYYEQDYYK